MLEETHPDVETVWLGGTSIKQRRSNIVPDLFRKKSKIEAPDIYFASDKCMGLRGAVCFLFCGRTAQAFLETIRGHSNRQKSSGQHRLQASSSQDSMEVFFSVSYGQECVLWPLEDELEQSANCTLEHDQPLENSKVWLQSKKKLVELILYWISSTSYQTWKICSLPPTWSWVSSYS